ncbi:MAG: CCA tRNA nucleotidyltransferase [Candidatus Hydrogenedentota bacterium]
MTDREREARAVCARLHEAGHQALLAGGCVRDLLLGHAPSDYDVATSARPREVMTIFSHTAPVGEAFGVVLVVCGSGPVEVATFRKDGPYLDGRHPSSVTFTDAKADAHRRDLTINALFLDPRTDAVLDYVGGRKDLRAGIVRTVGDPHQRFTEDYLRLLRTVRFAARLRYRIDGATWDALHSLAPHVVRTSAERIRDELLKMLTEGSARRALELLDETGLLEHILPEVAAMKGCEQPPAFHPEGDVWVHTLMLLDYIDAMNDPSPTLALAALLHDVGKPPTQTHEDRIRFNDHDKVGARMTEKICRRLRLSNEQMHEVVWLVEQHMRLAAVPEMRESKRRRFVREPLFPKLEALCRADAVASHGKLDTLQWIAAYRANLGDEALRPKPLLTGKDLIAMGYTPGPGFGALLQALEDAQLEGTISTRPEAEQFVREQWPPGA